MFDEYLQPKEDDWKPPVSDRSTISSYEIRECSRCEVRFQIAVGSTEKRCDLCRPRAGNLSLSPAQVQETPVVRASWSPASQPDQQEEMPRDFEGGNIRTARLPSQKNTAMEQLTGEEGPPAAAAGHTDETPPVGRVQRSSARSKGRGKETPRAGLRLHPLAAQHQELLRELEQRWAARHRRTPPLNTQAGP